MLKGWLSLFLCVCVASEKTPSPPTEISWCLQQGDTHTHTHTHTRRAHQWPVKEACQHYSTSAHILRQLQMWKTQVSVGQNFPADGQTWSVAEAQAGLAFKKKLLPTPKDPDTPG